MHDLILYIHGFNSSPASQKALAVQTYLQQEALALDFYAPTLSSYPGAAYRQLAALIESERAQRSTIYLIGSSLGGFFATVLAQRYTLRAVLINPVVRPHELMAALLGEHQNPYSGEHFYLDQRHVAEMQALAPAELDCSERLLVLLQTGDEVLDYRRAQDYYRGCQQVVEAGGDHRFQNFERHLPALLEFLKSGFLQSTPALD